jgi:hypothetical protein
MKSVSGNIRPVVRKAGFYLPFTWYFIVFSTGIFLVYLYLKQHYTQEENSYSAIFLLLIKSSVWFAGICVGIALLSVLVSFLIFLWMKKAGKVHCHVGHTQAADRTNRLSFMLEPVLRPLLGFVKIRLQYDDAHFSEKFSTVQKNDPLISNKINGIYNWQLPAIKEYNISKAIIYFEDMFQFFSLAVPVNLQHRFMNTPIEMELNHFEANPRKTEDTSVRIEELRRVEGEFINYKSFENNDDVRRIVWKIYARNKELVVRTPEIVDPYASHLYLYASFHSVYATGSSMISVVFLNYYKQMVWNTYRQLAAKGFDIKYIPDQQVTSDQPGKSAEYVKQLVSKSRWQQDTELNGYVQGKHAAAVIVSSLNDADEVSRLMEQYGNEITVVFVQLSHSLRKNWIGSVLQWLFLQNEKDLVEQWKVAWNLDPVRIKMERNERQIKEILERYTKPVLE